MRQSIFCITVMLGMVIFCMIAPGCVDSVPKNLVQKPQAIMPEPETGIAAWIVAVNDRDFGAVYDLMPVSKRAGISREQYIRLNRENPSPFLASEPVVTDFFILDKHADGLNATISAGLQTTRPSVDPNTDPVQEMVFFTFEETFEDYEWKVWTRK
jgi:hypothetical protein